MKVRAAAPKDAERCAEISPIRPATELRRLLKDSETQLLVIENDTGSVVGLGIIHLWPWNKMAWVWDLTIDEAERGKGHGRALLQGMIRAARKMGARVLMDFDTPESNPLADLYLKGGFRICGTNDRWFSDQREPTAVFYGRDL